MAHYCAIALNEDSANLHLMRKTQIKDEIAERHRRAVRKIMGERGLEGAPWCRRAGISEATLRNFLNGGNQSMGANNLELLAKVEGLTIGQLLGEEPVSIIDDELMEKCALAIQATAIAENKKIALAQSMVLAVKLYKHIMKYRRSDPKLQPSEAVASLIMKDMVA